MLDQKIKLQVKIIIKKIAENQLVSIDERIFIEKIAKKNYEISKELKRAQHVRRKIGKENNELTTFISELSLNGLLQEDHYNPKIGTLGEWFTNAPSWLKRS